MKKRRKPAPYPVSRRSVLRGMLSGAVAAAMPPVLGTFVSGCGDDDPDLTETFSVRTVRKRLHVALPPQLAAVFVSKRHADRLSLFVGSKTHSLTAHTPQTLAEANGHLLYGTPNETPTHFVQDVAFSVDGAQSFVLRYTTEDGRAVPLLGGIHVPTTRDLSRAEVALGAAEQDPTHLSVDDATIWAVYHDPGLISLEPSTAQAVIDTARGLSEYDALRFEIRKRLVATTGTMLERGEAWLSTVFELDKAGQRIRLRAFDGTPISDDAGNPAYEVSYVGAPAVLAASAALVSAATTSLNSKPEMEGVKYINAPARDLASGAQNLGNSSAERHFLHLDNNLTKSRRQIDIEIEGSELTAELKNHSALETILVIESYRGGITAAGESKVIGWAVVPSVFFPGVPISPEPYENKVRLEVKIPEDANEVRVWTTAAGFRNGVDGKLVSAAMNNFRAGAWVLDAVVDFALPAFFLGVGIGGALAKRTLNQVGKVALEHLIVDGVIDLVIEELEAGLGEGKSFADRIEEGSAALGGAIVKLCVRLMAEVLGAAGATLLTTGVAEVAATAAVPVVGWTLAVIGAAQTAVQLGFATEHLIVNKMFTVHRAIITRTVKVVVKPLAAEAQFPERAARYKVTLQTATDSETFLPLEQAGNFSSSAPSFDVGFANVPKLDFTLTVSLFDSQGVEVGVGFQNIGKPNDSDATFTATIETVGIPFTVTSRTRLTHTRKLVANPERKWVGSTVMPAPAPRDDDRALASNPRDLKVGGLGGITFSQTKQVIAYNFISPCDPSGFSSHCHDVTRDSGQATTTACGVSHSRMLVHSLLDHHCFIERLDDQTLAAFPYVPKATNLATFNARAAASTTGHFGTLHGTEILHARVHASAATLCAVTNFGIETLPIVAPSTKPSASLATTRRGSRPGQILSPVALAPFRTRNKLAVLESGENRRIQVFDLAGNLMPGDPIISLAQNPADPFTSLQHLDIEVDSNDNYWVLGLDTARHVFYLRVYTPSGGTLITLSGINAYRLALNLFNEAYMLNAENQRLANGSQYNEPTVSVWIPQTS